LALTDLLGGQGNAPHVFPRNADDMWTSARPASRISTREALGKRRKRRWEGVLPEFVLVVPDSSRRKPGPPCQQVLVRSQLPRRVPWRFPVMWAPVRRLVQGEGRHRSCLGRVLHPNEGS